MLIELKIRKLGSSLGVVLPKDVVARLEVEAGQSLFLIESPGGGYLLTSHATISTKAEDIIERYRNTLGLLAK